MNHLDGADYLHVDTDGLTTAQALDHFRFRMAPFFDVDHDRAAAAAAGSGFHARIEAWQRPDFLVSRTFASHVLYARSRRLVAQSGLDHYFVTFRPALPPAPGIDPRLCLPGPVIVADLGYAAEAFSADHTGIALFLPRERLDPHLTAPIPPQGLILPPFHWAAAVIADHVARLAATPDLPHPHTPDIIAGALARHLTVEGAARRFPAVTATRLRRYIEAHLHDETLDAANLSRRFGLSRAVLYGLFEPLGGVATYIRARRLERARAMLADPRWRHRSISAVGFAVGFNADAAFSRWFKRYHGINASDFRHETLPGI